MPLAEVFLPQRRGRFNGACHVGSGPERSTKYKLQTRNSRVTTLRAPCRTQLVCDPRSVGIWGAARISPRDRRERKTCCHRREFSHTAAQLCAKPPVASLPENSPPIRASTR